MYEGVLEAPRANPDDCKRLNSLFPLDASAMTRTVDEKNRTKLTYSVPMRPTISKSRTADVLVTSGAPITPAP